MAGRRPRMTRAHDRLGGTREDDAEMKCSAVNRGCCLDGPVFGAHRVYKCPVLTLWRTSVPTKHDKKHLPILRYTALLSFLPHAALALQCRGCLSPV